MNYDDEHMLMLSGIQHYMFCPRQWALIHIEQQWNENRFTVEGQFLHKNVDDPSYRQKNGECISLRSVPIASKTLGLYGFTDVVELHPSEKSENSILHPDYPGHWKPHPIEYKRGHVKPDERDEVQLAAQTICLEEMYGVEIDCGYLFYGETRRREKIIIDARLRNLTQQCADEMHKIYDTFTIPKAVKTSKCSNCSLLEICSPNTKNRSSVDYYLTKNLYEKVT